jgi:hypothetical protein
MTTYLGILGSLWSSAVSVADLLQTDDLFQLAQPRELPPLPEFDQLPAWPCCHDCPPQASDGNSHPPCAAAPPASGTRNVAATTGISKPSAADKKPAPAAAKPPEASTWVERNPLPQSEVTGPSHAAPSTGEVTNLQPALKARKRQRFAPSSEEIPTTQTTNERQPSGTAAAKEAPIP